MFFLLNDSLSSNPIHEIYYYQPHIEKTGNTYATTSLLELEGNKYSDYIGIRFIFNDDVSRVSRYIDYTFEEGFFGYRVLKDYEFSWDDPRNAIYSK